MPIPERVSVSGFQYKRKKNMEQQYDPWQSHCIGWKKTFAVWPRRCYITNKILWLKFVYQGTAMWTGPGEPAYEHRWIKSNEFMFAKIKGII